MDVLKKCMLVWLLLLPFIGYSNDKGWSVSTQDIKGEYAGVTVANGRIGVVLDRTLFQTKEVVLNGVYDKKSRDGVSCLMNAINPMNLRVAIDGTMLELSNVSDWKQTLNMKEAIFSSSFAFQDKAEISYEMVAPRNLPYAAMMVVHVTPHKDIELDVRSMLKYDRDRWSSPSLNSRILIDNEVHIPLVQSHASSVSGNTDFYTTSAFLFDGQRPQLGMVDFLYHPQLYGFSQKLKKGKTYEFSFVSSFCTDKDFADPKNESERFVIYAMQNHWSPILEHHKRLWKELWSNDIIIKGDLDAQRDVRLALFHLFSFISEDSRLSIAPMGLSSSNGYNGHIFWDAEMWMFPVLLLFDAPLAKSMIDYRIDRLAKAKKRAYSYGYKGAMYPWESDVTGEETTPTWALTGTFEHHITADIGWAAWNYYLVTQDQEWLKSDGYPLLKEIADFWVSRSILNNDGSYSIKNVVGADEFAPNVDDNAFTNAVAQYVLRAASKAALLVDKTPDKRWSLVAEKMRFHYFKDGVMKEHASYQGEIIKQADVNLLTYPLATVKDKHLIHQNLKYYEQKLAPEGPAMAHSIYSIIYAKEGNKKEAYRLFRRGYIPNKRPPFGVLSETPYHSNPYFATGAGGMLQTVLFGFAGYQITEDGIVKTKQCLPTKWKSIEVKGVESRP